MTLPERKVLEKLNDVSTAKRLANMVSLTSFAFHMLDLYATRNCTIRTLANVKKFIGSKEQNGGPS
jgi:hypothetical protein